MFRRRNLISASSWKTRLVSVTFSIPSEPFFRKGFVQPHSSDTSTKLSTSASNTTVTSQYHGLLHYHKAAASHQKILCSSIKMELKWKQHLLLKSNLYRIIFHYGRLSKILLLSFINNEKAKSNKTKMPLFFTTISLFLFSKTKHTSVYWIKKKLNEMKRDLSFGNDVVRVEQKLQNELFWVFINFFSPRLFRGVIFVEI